MGNTMAVTRRAAAATDYLEPEGEEKEVEVAVDLEDEDPDETPRNAGIIQSGWKAAKKQKESGGDFAKDFRPSEDEQLVKFLDDEPFAVYQQHWIERTGKRSFVCIGTGCPLCAVGDRPRKMYAFNVVVIEDAETVEHKMLTAGTRLLDQLEKANEGKKGPLTKAYWSISRSGSSKAGWTNNVTPVAPRDLDEDWSLNESALLPLLKEVVPYTSAIISIPSKAQLREIAEELE